MTKYRNFWEKNKVLSRFPSGLRKNYSTNTFLGHLTKKTGSGFVKGLFAEMIFIDLQKSLGTIDHQIMVKKMKYIGFSKNAIAWFKFYLSQRKFKTNINTSYSIPSNLICGAPQGSVLKPLLFLLHIDHLAQAVVSDLLICYMLMLIVFQHKSIIEIEKQLLREVSLTGLIIRKIKHESKSVLFGIKRKLQNSKVRDIV